MPRLTLLNVVRGEAIPNRVYRLDPAQLDAIKDFIKSGKPVLFCLGPTNESAARFDPEGAGGDGLEPMLSQSGFPPLQPDRAVQFRGEIVRPAALGRRHPRHR